MIDRVTYNGRSELAEAKILNMSVAKYYGLVKEYAEILRDTRRLNEKQLAKDKAKAELNIIYSVRYNLNWLVLQKLQGDKHENSRPNKKQ
jgi:hypothetical protein